MGVGRHWGRTTQEPMSKGLSPLSALFQLLCFKRRIVGMTERHFDDCFDVVTGLLEEANNERFRLTPSQEQDDSGDN